MILFSGYTLEEILEDNFEGSKDLLSYTDVLIDGEYIDELYDESRGFIGSSNQVVYFLIDFYTQEDFDKYNNTTSIEILIDRDSLQINGWPHIFN